MKQGMNHGEIKTCRRADGCGQNFTRILRMGGKCIYLCCLDAQSWLWPSSPRAIEVDPETKSPSAFGGGRSMQKDRWMNMHSMVLMVHPLRGDGGGWVLSDATTPPSQKQLLSLLWPCVLLLYLLLFLFQPADLNMASHASMFPIAVPICTLVLAKSCFTGARCKGWQRGIMSSHEISRRL